MSECPNCHRPLEEGDLCCADAKLRWRCRSCAKVSAGFAFAYGSCPLCGGELQPIGRGHRRPSANSPTTTPSEST